MAESYGKIIRSAQVKCPFYITDDLFAKTLTCEGCSEDHLLSTRFSSYEAKNKHMAAKCAKNYKLCPIYKLVMDERYGGED